MNHPFTPAAPLHLFYAEPDPDRWFPGDRWPRALVRHLLRGKPQPGGMMRYYLNLRAGLDQLGIPYRTNDYGSLRRQPGALAAVIGKHHIVETIPAGHPVIFGPAVPSHPQEQPAIFARENLRLTVLSSDWHAALYREAGIAPTAVWAAGIATERWTPAQRDLTAPAGRVMLYDKIRWDRATQERTLLQPIRAALRQRGFEVVELQYGNYLEDDYRALLSQVEAIVFLCEHETQGFAYLQALSCGVPMLAWDRGGDWCDPQAAKLGVKFSGVSSVPYWDARCGVRFADADALPAALEEFCTGLVESRFDPRAYIEAHFTLAACAQRFVELTARVTG